MTCGTHEVARTSVRRRHRHIIQGTKEKCKDDHLDDIDKCVHCNPLMRDVKNGKQEIPGKMCINECPRDCEYSNWQQWTSTLNKKCPYCNPAKGTAESPKEMWRTRNVKHAAVGDGEPCTHRKETLACKDVHVDKKCTELKVTQWSDWSGCQFKVKGDEDVNCKSVEGEHVRVRYCKSTKREKGKKHSCKEKLRESKPCVVICKGTDPYENWSEWTDCKGSGLKKENGQQCGSGKRHRTRKCHKWIKKNPDALDKFCRKGKEEKASEVCGSGPCGVEKATKSY